MINTPVCTFPQKSYSYPKDALKFNVSLSDVRFVFLGEMLLERRQMCHYLDLVRMLFSHDESGASLLQLPIPLDILCLSIS